MKRALWVGILTFVSGLSATPSPAAACSFASPPCDQIPVILDIQLAKSRGLTFGEKSELVFQGTVSFYVDIDQNGWWHDAQTNPTMTLQVNRQPPWVKVEVKPSTYEVPVNDPQYVAQDAGGPGQVRYYWEAPITVKVHKLQDPSVDDLAPTSRHIRHDGTYRVSLSAATESSLPAKDVIGSNMGLQEGYVGRELRFMPEINGVQWLPDEQGILQPSDGIIPGQTAAGKAPAAGLGLIALAIAGLLAVMRRRRA